MKVKRRAGYGILGKVMEIREIEREKYYGNESCADCRR